MQKVWILGLLLAAMLVCAGAAEAPDGDFEYSLYGDGAIGLESYTGAGGTVTVPARIDGLPVRFTASSFLYFDQTVEELTFSGDMLQIEGLCNCERLTAVTIPGTVNLLDGLRSCPRLERVTIGDGVEQILGSTFWNCPALREVYIPASVRLWEPPTETDTVFLVDGGSYALSVCKARGLRYRLVSGEDKPAPGRFLTTELEDGTLEITGYEGWETEVTIPAEIDGKRVSGIAAYAFQDNGLFTSVTIGEGISRLGNGAFYYCGSLERVSVPGSVREIGSFCFFECGRLRALELGEGIRSIAYSALEGCDSLRELRIPQSVTSLDPWQNPETRQTTLIVQPGSAAHGYALDHGMSCQVDGEFDTSRPYGFYTYELDENGYANLLHYYGTETRITVPAWIDGHPVTAVGDGVFRANRTAGEFIIPEGIFTLGKEVFPPQTSLVRLPSTLIGIGDFCFSGCRQLQRISLPAGLSLIGQQAFAGTGLTEVRIPDTVVSVGEYAFSNCTKLTTASLPYAAAGLAYAFDGCTSLTSVLLREGMPALPEGIFRGCNDLSGISLPTSLRLIGGEAFLGCGSLQTIDLSHVSYIGSRAFNSCGALREVRLGPGLLGIEGQAFAFDVSLKTLDLPDSILGMGEYIFDNGRYEPMDITLTVGRDTIPHQYAKAYGIKYRIRGEATPPAPSGSTRVVKAAEPELNYELNLEVASLRALGNLLYYTDQYDQLVEAGPSGTVPVLTAYRGLAVTVADYDAQTLTDPLPVRLEVAPEEADAQVICSLRCYAADGGITDTRIFTADVAGDAITFSLSAEQVGLMARSDACALLCFALTWEKARYMGDVNGDGEIGMADAAALLASLCGTGTEVDAEAADLDGDGAVTMDDLAALVGYLAGR